MMTSARLGAANEIGMSLYGKQVQLAMTGRACSPKSQLMFEDANFPEQMSDLSPISSLWLLITDVNNTPKSVRQSLLILDRILAQTKSSAVFHDVQVILPKTEESAIISFVWRF